MNQELKDMSAGLKSDYLLTLKQQIGQLKMLNHNTSSLIKLTESKMHRLILTTCPNTLIYGIENRRRFRDFYTWNKFMKSGVIESIFWHRSI